MRLKTEVNEGGNDNSFIVVTSEALIFVQYFTPQPRNLIFHHSFLGYKFRIINFILFFRKCKEGATSFVIFQMTNSKQS